MPAPIHIDTASLHRRFLEGPDPPWRPMKSKHLSERLGVSLQTLANWRVRDLGPQPEPSRRGGGNRVFYRPDRVMAWLEGPSAEPWRQIVEWMALRKLRITPCTPETIAALTKQLDTSGIWKGMARSVVIS